MGCVYRGSLCSGFPHCPFVYRSTLELIMGDIQFIEEVMKEQEWQYLTILQKMDMARRDGYFTVQDVKDIQSALGLSTETRQ